MLFKIEVVKSIKNKNSLNIKENGVEKSVENGTQQVTCF